ncbi:hypothetical protein SprV_0100459000 [Sparganum proliferum]
MGGRFRQLPILPYQPLLSFWAPSSSVSSSSVSSSSVSSSSSPPPQFNYQQAYPCSNSPSIPMLENYILTSFRSHAQPSLVDSQKTEIFEMASRMRQGRDTQRESLALSDSNPAKSVAHIFRHRFSSKRGHELPPLLNDNKVFLIDDTDKAELFSALFAKHLITESEPVPFFRSLSDRTLSTIDVSSDLSEDSGLDQDTAQDPVDIIPPKPSS